MCVLCVPPYPLKFSSVGRQYGYIFFVVVKLYLQKGNKTYLKKIFHSLFIYLLSIQFLYTNKKLSPFSSHINR